MFSFLKSIYRILLELIKPNIWILEGDEKTTNKNLKIIYIGTEKSKNYIMRTTFTNVCSEVYLGKKFFWNAYYMLSKNTYKCSLAIVEGTSIDKYLYGSVKDFLVPLWVDSVTDLPLIATNSSAKRDLQRLRSNKLEYIVTRDDEMLHDFYYNMHRPMIRDRYQSGVFEISYDGMKETMKENCYELLLIKKNDVFISGIVFQSCEDIPRLWKNGIRDIKYWGDGAIAATYVFPSDYLWKKGYKKVSYGQMRSFLNDGLLQYKKKWNITLKVASRRGYILKPLHTSAGLKGFFENNPFIYMERNMLFGAVFMDEDEQYSEEDFRQLQKKYDMKGLSELNVFIIRENGTFNLLGPLKKFLSVQ